MKNIFCIIIGIIFIGCASKQLDYNVTKVNFYTPVWYKDFNQTTLNELVADGLNNNEDLGVALLNLRQAMLRAGLKRDDLFPTFSAQIGANSSRDLSRNDSFKNGFSSEFSMSYELDVFGKIFDSYESSNWSAISTKLTFDDLRLTIINSISDLYFNILFTNDIIRNLELNLQNLQELDRLVKIKYELGKEEVLSLRQSRQNILNIKNQILERKRELTTNYEMLKNLTRSNLNFDNLSINNVKNNNVDLNLTFDSLKNRPDINEAIANLNSSFYDYKSISKSLYPSITIGASLSDSDQKFSDSFGFNTLGGVLNINFPFLDYSRLKKNIRITKTEFYKNVLNYEKVLSNASNEVIKYVGYYNNDKEDYTNLLSILKEQQMIVLIYESKYELGKAELKDLLEAKNSLLNTENTILNQKYRLLNDEIGYYKAVAR